MSNRLTFSLASLIFLIAFGLVFGTTSVMAHEDATSATDTPREHPHPLAQTLVTQSDADGTTPGTEVTAHYGHPTVTSVMLKAGATVRDNMAVITADDTNTADVNEHGLTLVVTFSQEVNTTDGSSLVVTAADLIEAGDFTVQVRNAKGAIVTGSPATVAGGGNVVTRVTNNNMAFEVPVTFDTTAIPDGTADDPLEYLTFYVQVGAGAAFGLAMPAGINADIPGGASYKQATPSEFKLVAALPTLTPTVMIEAAADATVDGPFVVTFTFSEPAPSAFVAGDITVTGGFVSAGPTQDTTNTKMWTATITPGVGATAVMVSVADKATGDEESVTATTDSTDPTVTIAMGTQDGRTLPIMITMADDTALASDAAIDAASDVTVTGGELGMLTRTGDVYSGDITINYDTASVMVTVAEDAVADTSSNTSAAASETFTVTAIPTPTGAMLNAGEYIVVVRDKANPPPFGNLSPKLVSWSEVSDEAEMPDLERLFDVGGTIQLKVTGATGLQVVFSEVMWAVDQGNVDNRAAYLGEQWIELLNRTSDKNFAISAIKISSKEGRPALAQETDRISNVVGAGADWVLGKGQNGNSGATDGSGRVEFISMYRDNEGKAGQQYEAGHASASWTKSTELYATNHRGTPGQIERTEVHVIGTTNVPRSPIIFNEIGHHSDPRYEWIELRNVSGGNVNLKNYEVTIVTNKTTDNDFIDFTGADRNVPAGGILLVVKNDPTGDPNHPLAAGWNFGARNTWTVAQPGQAHYVPGVNENSARYMVASSFGDLPSTGEFVLVLRNRQDRNGSTANDNIRDIAGYHPDLKIDDGTRFTNLWPLSNFHDAKAVQNKFDQGTVHRRQHAGVNGTDRSRRDRGGNADDGAFRDDGWSGIGYKRNADANAVNGGTPGHPDSAHARHNRFDATTRSSVIISEIMIDQGPRNLPEWIELFNTSRTEAVSVHNWRITITNHDRDSADGGVGSFAGDLSITVTLGNHVIPPRQSYLVVARSARNNTMLPKERIHPVNRRAGQLLLNPYGFQIKVDAYEKANVYHHVETIGNLGPAPANDRRSNAQSFEPISWMLPNTIGANSSRISLVRTSDTMGPVDGMTRGAWKLFDMSQQLGRTLDATSYGHSSDQGSPGHNAGGVLPVELSTFRPQRLDDGSVAIRWITESELDNAGFNILRSDTRDGQFTKLNTQLIAGQGTTSERTAYEWKDTTAKPNVVYYYQIQDVSMDGDIATLRTNRLRGHVSPSGKATTTWGELKSLQ